MERLVRQHQQEGARAVFADEAQRAPGEDVGDAAVHPGRLLQAFGDRVPSAISRSSWIRCLMGCTTACSSICSML
jgi:hypothetical protein